MCVLNMCLFFRFTSCVSFYSVLSELNDYAGQREVVAEDMGNRVYGELMRYSQDLKAERKHVSTAAKSYVFNQTDVALVSSVSPFIYLLFGFSQGDECVGCDMNHLSSCFLPSADGRNQRFDVFGRTVPSTKAVHHISSLT